MGKGVVPDSSPCNASAARSTAMKEADVVLVLGAKLNWILSFGLPPKWSPNVNIIQVDISADELGKNGGNPSMSLVGDVGLVVDQLLEQFGNWRWQGQSTPFYKNLEAAKKRNGEKAAKKVAVQNVPVTFERAYDIIKSTLNRLSSEKDGDVVYVAEGANAMDISRSSFTVEHPRTRLDAGTYATMGVGLGYAIAAYAAYNFPGAEGLAGKRGSRKKIVAIEGDSAFGFSAMEVDTMARYQMDVLIFVMNNSGLYRGDTDNKESWEERRRNTVAGTTQEGKGLTAWSLGYQTDYQKVAEMAGGIGILVRTPEELAKATEEGFKAKVPVVVNVLIDPQADLPMVSRSLFRGQREGRVLIRHRTSHGWTWCRKRKGRQNCNRYPQRQQDHTLAEPCPHSHIASSTPPSLLKSLMNLRPPLLINSLHRPAHQLLQILLKPHKPHLRGRAPCSSHSPKTSHNPACCHPGRPRSTHTARRSNE